MQQLKLGIRLLDLRISVTESGSGQYVFYTCHSDHGLGLKMNQYQTLVSFMNECRDFLRDYPTEGLVLSVKIDDDGGLFKNPAAKDTILNALYNVLETYPILPPNTESGKYQMRTMGEFRGNIFLLNRINDDVRFGAPVTWDEATPGMLVTSYADKRDFAVYVQDKYKGLPAVAPEDEKANLVIAAFEQKPADGVLLNYASATYFFLIGVNAQPRILSWLGQSPAAQRTKTLGWVFLDKEDLAYDIRDESSALLGERSLCGMIIDSNFDYGNTPGMFTVDVPNQEL
ncbi:MAG: hypothetical protein LBK67_09975 [Coriobacteriales bacterium]|nr:hypothetical protein [Coriobacteriales bacterium]